MKFWFSRKVNNKGTKRIHHSRFNHKKEEIDEELFNEENEENRQDYIQTFKSAGNLADMIKINSNKFATKNDSIHEDHVSLVNKIDKLLTAINSFKVSSEISNMKQNLDQHDEEIMNLISQVEKLEKSHKSSKERLQSSLVENVEYLTSRIENNELVLKEVVKETQENHRQILCLSKIHENVNKSLARTASQGPGNNSQIEKNSDCTPKLYNDMISSRRMISVLDMSDFNGLGDFDGDNGLIQETTSVNSYMESEPDDDKVQNPLEEKRRKDSIEEQFNQILEGNKESDENEQFEKMDYLAPERLDSKAKINKSVTSKDLGKVSPNRNKITRSTMLLQSIIEEKRWLKPKNELKSKNTNHRFTSVEEKKSQIENQKNNVAKEFISPLKQIEKSVPLNFENSCSPSESNLNKLKREYFNICVLVESMQHNIDSSSINSNELWREAKENVPISSYTSFVSNEMK